MGRTGQRRHRSTQPQTRINIRLDAGRHPRPTAKNPRAMEKKQSQTATLMKASTYRCNCVRANKRHCITKHQNAPGSLSNPIWSFRRHRRQTTKFHAANLSASKTERMPQSLKNTYSKRYQQSLFKRMYIKVLSCALCRVKNPYFMCHLGSQLVVEKI